MAEKNKKIVTTFKRPFQFHLGAVLFGLVLIYLISCVVLYFVRDRVTVYQVKAGEIMENGQYTGLALRQEEVVNAQQNGYITYVAPEGTKAGIDTYVYGLSDQPGGSLLGDLSQMMSKENYSSLYQEITGFETGFDTSDFYDVYRFKSALQGSIFDAIRSTALSNKEDGDQAMTNMVKSEKSGVVVYSVDGFEGVGYQNLTKDMMSKNQYSKTELKANESVQAGSPAYKLVTGEDWELVIRLDPMDADRYVDDDYVQVKFLKDQNTVWAQLEKFQIDDETYCRLKFSNSMIRYATDRFLEVEVIINSVSGLKVPNSSIVVKKFYTIPLDFVISVEEKEAKVKMLPSPGSPSSSAFEETVTIYDRTDEAVYVNMEDIQEGTIILNPKNDKRTYAVGTIGELKGVYNINRGYAEFSLVNVLYRNDEYCIVKSNESYGLSVYDRIVLDGSEINDEQQVYQ